MNCEKALSLSSTVVDKEGLHDGYKYNNGKINENIF